MHALAIPIGLLFLFLIMANIANMINGEYGEYDKNNNHHHYHLIICSNVVFLPIMLL